MKIARIVLSLALLAVCSPSHAQFLKKLKKKAENAMERTVERRASKEVEKSTDRVLDSVLEGNGGESRKKSEETNPNATILQGMFGDKATIEDQYAFDMLATMLLETKERRSKTMEVVQGYGENAIVTFQKDTENPVILDFENKSAIMLDLKRESGQAVSLSFMEKMMGETEVSETEEEMPTITKTGNTKTLNGYRCEEYEIVSDEYKTIAWYAPDVDFQFHDYLKGFAKVLGGKNKGQFKVPKDMQGYAMQIIQYDKKGKLVSKMTVTDINKTETIYKMSDFSIQKM